MDRLITMLHAHLDREEQTVVPLLDGAETASGDGERAGANGAGANGG